jgi:hypothetical protein
MQKTTTLEQVLNQARKLSPLDKLRLIERVAPDLEKELEPRAPGKDRSLLGLCRDLGAAPSEEDIDEARREAWGGFARAEGS